MEFLNAQDGDIRFSGGDGGIRCVQKNDVQKQVQHRDNHRPKDHGSANARHACGRFFSHIDGRIESGKAKGNPHRAGCKNQPRKLMNG